MKRVHTVLTQMHIQAYRHRLEPMNIYSCVCVCVYIYIYIYIYIYTAYIGGANICFKQAYKLPGITARGAYMWFCV